MPTGPSPEWCSRQHRNPTRRILMHCFTQMPPSHNRHCQIKAYAPTNNSIRNHPCRTSSCFETIKNSLSSIIRNYYFLVDPRTVRARQLIRRNAHELFMPSISFLTLFWLLLILEIFLLLETAFFRSHSLSRLAFKNNASPNVSGRIYSRYASFIESS